MRLAICSVLAAAAALFSAWAASPAEALGQGRARIASGDCQGAIAILQDAIPQANALTPEKTKAEALGAIHFYSALAFANCRQADKAKDSIRQFLRVHPGRSALDASKYPRQFIELFEEVQRLRGSSRSTHPLGRIGGVPATSGRHCVTTKLEPALSSPSAVATQ